MFTRFYSAILLFLLFIAGYDVTAQPQTSVILPETTIEPGRSATLDIVLACPAANCIGIDLTVVYDAGILRVEDVVPASYLGDLPRVTSQEYGDGMFRFAALSTSGASGETEGVVLRMNVTGLGSGESSLTVTSLTIFRRGGTVQASWRDGLIRVAGDAPTANAPILRVSRRLTVRSGPGAEFSASATVQPGAELEVLGISVDGNWFLVALPAGAQGWLPISRFTVLSGSPEQLPVIPQPEITAEATADEAATEPTETLAPTRTPSNTPTTTETATPLPTNTMTLTAIPTALPTNTPIPIGPTLTPVPTETETSPPTQEPTASPEPPTATPTDTPVRATATLRSDSEAQLAPPATDTPAATNTSTSEPTNTSQPTLTPSPTSTPAPPTLTLTLTVTIPEPCTVITNATNVPVSVGPNRVARTTFPANQAIRVTGQQQAGDGSLWWRIEPLGGSLETDRFWVRQSDVTAQGDCAAVENAESPRVISSGAGSQFTGTFRSGQPFATHNFTIGTAGNYQIVCSGSPVYPEFSVGSSQSRGQTTISASLTPGRYTLTVFSSTVNSGQTVWLTSYTCSLSRR